MSARNRGTRPASAPGKVREPAPPPSYDKQTPKFCLHHLQRDFDVHALDAAGQSAFARTLQKLSAMNWTELITSGRHGCGLEHIAASEFKPAIPARFQDQEKFTVFRYRGKLPMAGVRVADVFHVLWIEPRFNDLYDHGS